ncbi:transmembrane protein 178B-like [Dreissena polymorpha]|uniref:Uncharacterized protein n=1 Tax=Dreissena polymorpha TaxID=45954 RepID=A0A9D4LRA4_DREPO|nr:transmembrane protein 178B-like [Dreissena polymorpha]KAH3863525.1 hypothetical protein DPMN_026514 [Dreissena polymorpha]
MARSSCATGNLIVATILGPIVLVLLAISFATDHWLEYDVNKSLLTTTHQTDRDTNIQFARYTHDRHRGLWRECYPGNDTQFLDNVNSKYGQELIDKYCFFVRLEIPEKGNNVDWTSEFVTRIHLMRVWVAFFIVALTVFLVSYIFGLVLCCWRQSKWAYIAGLLAYIAAFFTAASIAFFHGAEYLERNKIKDVDPLTGKFWFAWEEDVKNATDRDYGYSYIIGWIGMALAAITATLYSVAGCFIGGERYKDEYGEKGRSRDYLERSYPMPLEAQPYYPKGYYQYGAGPYLYDMENRQPLPAITYGPPPGAYFQGY